MEDINKTLERFFFPVAAMCFFVGASFTFSYYVFSDTGSNLRFILYAIIFSSFSLPVFLALYVYHRKKILEMETFSKETNRVLEDNMELLSKVNALLEREIYERSEAEETLKESEETLKKITSSASDAIIMIDNSGCTTFWSTGAEKIFGYKSEEVMNKDIHKLIAHHDFFESYTKAFPEFAATGHGNAIGKTVELMAVKKDGTVFPVELSLSAVRIKGAWNAVGIVRDITTRKSNEDNLRKLSAAVEHTADSVIIANIDGCIEFVNRAYLSLKGIMEQDVIGKHIKDINEKPFTDEFFAKLRTSVIEGDVYRGVAENKDINGEHYYMEITVSPVRDPKGTVTHFISTGRDITYNYIAAEALIQSEEKFRSLVNNIPDVIWTCDVRGKVVFISKNVEELLGQTPLEFQKAVSIYDSGCIAPEDVGKLKAAYAELFENNKPFSVEVRAINKDGRQLWLMCRSMLSYEKGGRLYADGALTDITEIKLIQNELNKAKEEAEQANRAKSEFLSLMSHELRTPMNAILGFAQLLESDPYDPLTTYQLENTAEILKAGSHLLELIDNVLDLSKIESGRVKLSFESVNLQTLIEECISLTAPIGESRRVSITSDMESCTVVLVRADWMRLKQVMLNLISNGVKYSKEGGSVFIQCRRAAEMLEVSVSDYGIGISKENMKCLFQPFSNSARSSDANDGLGIGLVMTKKLISLMGGTMGVESEEGRGSRFYFTIPIATTFPDNEFNKELSCVCDDSIYTEGKGKFTILYIEDNPASVTLLGRIVSRYNNMRFISAMNGLTGVQLALEHKPDVILTDINLPDISGTDVLKRIRENVETSQIPVIALSGFVDDGASSTVNRNDFTGFLLKPFNFKELMGIIEGLLAKKVKEQ
ncbi:hybrid sensor histidine kinase/response regulator [Candidatus Magnetomonas plexicatena]|uniref:hybrid sensor histidine kinase/response regulator n=1 Tax=Candidatus Magnetomonas plexicatena TaxID=2552947 RepID=UPI001C78AC5C|nr:PAS domain S-box protein [Nitrospirales bacterium LBB_01]